MKAAIAAITVGSAALAAAVFLACGDGEQSGREFVVSADSNVVVLTVGIGDIVAPGNWQYDLFGDGWFRLRSGQLKNSRGPSDAGVALGRAELEALFADLVDYGVVEADLARIHEEIEPSHGILPDGRRWVQGSSEPGAGFSISATFNCVRIGSELVRGRAVSFRLEPFVRYRAKRPDIRALEGIARVGERASSWIVLLEEATKNHRR